ncbi:hypothetical protein [Sorangium sp. So ce854]|uniref:hypothetical protein n=1 Tax=Sorangium sp. So ce854 TaxID=3133322 RepID=UPI003F634B65
MAIVAAGCADPAWKTTGEPVEPAPGALATEYQPALGAGVNYAETRTFRTCITSTAAESTPGAMSRTYNETKVTSAKELREALDISASFSAVGLWGKVGAEMSYFKDVSIQSDAFYWLVDANYIASDERIQTNSPGFGLTADARVMLERHGLQAFYGACGTHFYSGRSLGARYTLLYEFESKQDKVVERLKAQASYSGFGVQARASFSRFLDMAERASILKVHSQIIGGGDEIKDYVKDAEALESELQRLRTDLLHGKRGVVLRWSMMSYDVFPEVVAAKRDAGLERIADSFREDALEHYYDLYTDNRRTLTSLTTRIDMSGSDEPMHTYGPDKIQAMRRTIDDLLAQNDEISRRAKSCIREENDCPTAGLTPLHSQIPEPDQDLSGLGRWLIQPDVPLTSRLAINLSGRPDVPGAKRRFFDTRHLLTETAAGAVLETTGQDGRPMPIVIGDFSPVINPSTGRLQPNLCLGDYAAVCNLRAVEHPRTRMDDRYPATKLQISIFDKDGFIVDQIHFLASG